LDFLQLPIAQGIRLIAVIVSVRYVPGHIFPFLQAVHPIFGEMKKDNFAEQYL
jgi:hypothetical protein